MAKRIVKSYFVVGFFVIFCSWYLNETKKVQVHVETSQNPITLSMPLKDKKRLEYLFYDMVIRESGGYTLFGNKPMHMNCYFKPFCMSKWYYFLASLCPPNLRKCAAWKTWKKYEHYFVGTKFLLFAEDNPFFTGESVSICLINKEKFCEMVNNHIIDFQTVLGREEISGEKLLHEIQTQPFLKHILKMHDGLIGTLFGYGRDNAWMFEERKEGIDVPLAFLWESEGIDEFYKNRPRFYWWYLGNCSYDLPAVLDYPSFMADLNSEETRSLKEGFHKTRQKIIEYYKGKDFLEATLALLFEGSLVN